MIFFWHRRDLRSSDLAGLFAALCKEINVQPVFIFDSNILEELNPNDQRVLFIHQQIQKLKKTYNELGSDIWVFYGTPEAIFKELLKKHRAKAVYANRDYEPYAKTRDLLIENLLKQQEIPFRSLKDHVIFERNEVVKGDGTPYRVYTPYMRQWKNELTPFHLKAYPVEKYLGHLKPSNKSSSLLSLKEIGFEDKQIQAFPSTEVDQKIIENYHHTRDIPSVNGTTRMSVHLRFGTVSIRALFQE